MLKYAELIFKEFLCNSRPTYKRFLIFSTIVYLIILLFYQTSFLDIVKYIGFQIVYVFLPGRLLYRLLRLEFEKSTILVWSYAFGVAASIIEFLICSYFQSLFFLYFAGPVMGFIELFIMVRKKEYSLLPDIFRFLPVQVWTIYGFLLLITGFGLTLASPQPELLNNATYFKDVIWMIGNAQALLKGILPYDIRLSGVIFKYHFFGAVYWATINYVTHIDLFTIVYKLYSIGNLFLVTGAVFVLGKTVLKETRKALFFTWVYFFTNCASITFAARNGYGLFLNVNFVHLTTDPFGFELALPFYLLTAVLCIEQLRYKINFGYLAATVMLLFICTGAKGPSGFMIFGSLLVVISAALILRKATLSMALLTTCAIATSLGVYYFFISSPGSSNGLFFRPGFTVENTRIGVWLSKVINNEGITLFLDRILIPFHFWCFLPFASVPFVYWCIAKIKRLNNCSLIEVFVGTLAFSGIILSYTLGQYGQSQIYFIMFSIPFIDLIAVVWLSEHYDNGISYKFKRFIRNMFILTTITMLSIVYFNVSAGLKGVGQVLGNKPSYPTVSADSISRQEYQAMVWLRDNTDPASLVAGDKLYIDSENRDSRHFYYSAFSGRQFFLEGWSYSNATAKETLVPWKLNIINGLYSSSSVNKKEIMRQNNIDYLVLSRVIHPDSSIFDSQLRRVFENQDVKIYRPD